MILLIFVLSISLPLGYSQSVSHHDIFNPFYKSKLSKSEPISIQTISGRFYEETKKEVTIQPHDRHQNTQITEPTDCANDFLNYRRKIGLTKEKNESGKPFIFSQGKENQTSYKYNSSTTHLESGDQTITSAKNKILETQKKEVQFDSLIVNNNLNGEPNKYEHIPKLISEIKDELDRPIDNNYNNYRRMFEHTPTLVSHDEDHLARSIAENLDIDPKKYEHTLELISQNEDEANRSHENDFYNDPKKYKFLPKLISLTKEDLLLNRSTGEDFNNGSKKNDSTSKLVSRNEDHLDQAINDDLNKKEEHKTKLISQVEDELDRSINEDIGVDSVKNKHITKLISSKEENLLFDSSVGSNYNNDPKKYELTLKVISQNDDKIDQTIDENLNNDPEKYESTPKLISQIEENLVSDRSVDGNVNNDLEKYESTPKLNSQIEGELDSSVDHNLNKNHEKYDTTPKVILSVEGDLHLNSTRNVSGVHNQSVQSKSEEVRQQTDNSHRINFYDVIARKSYNYKKTLCDEAESKSSFKELEKENDETVTQVREPTKGLGISEMTKSRVIIMQHPRVCYACSSINDPSCWSPDRRTSVKYCRKDHTSCLTKVFMQKGTRYIIRDCGSTCLPKTTFESAPVYKLCTICHNDLCNSAFAAKIQVFVIIIFVLFHPIFSR